MKRIISWVEECDGHLCDTVSLSILTILSVSTMIIMIAQLS
jgi:hypothetical protein